MATVEAPYFYDLSGLRNAYLAGILVRQCPRCHAESPVIPRIAELHRVMARHLVHKPGLLRGDEIRFLRKHAGFPARKFAALLGVDPSHLSRVENGHIRALGPTADRLARAVAAATLDWKTARETLLRVAAEIEEKSLREARQLPLFRLVRNRWQTAA